MAPEFPPILVIFDARFERNVLKGVLEYVESGSTQRLRVRWSVGSQPRDYCAVGGGVAYVYDKGSEFQIMPVSEDAEPTDLGDSRYQWTEGLQFGKPWLMFVLILPKHYTLVDPWPKPIGTKIFRERLALYWTLKGDEDFERTAVECTIREFHGDLESELMQLNKDYLSRKVPNPRTISVDEVAEVSGRKIFISYSHKDRDYLERLLVHLKPLEKAGLIDPWVDTRLKAGDRWKQEIELALQSASVAIVLVSADFLASDFVVENELPPILAKAKLGGTRIIPLIVKPCRFTRDPNLSKFQSHNPPEKPLSSLSDYERERVFDSLAEILEESTRE